MILMARWMILQSIYSMAGAEEQNPDHEHSGNWLELIKQVGTTPD